MSSKSALDTLDATKSIFAAGTFLRNTRIAGVECRRHPIQSLRDKMAAAAIQTIANDLFIVFFSTSNSFRTRSQRTEQGAKPGLVESIQLSFVEPFTKITVL
jgi:hypothetical protein